MAKRTIYFPDEISEQMDQFPDENWSGVCQSAVRLHINHLNARRNNVSNAIERAKARLEVSKDQHVAQARERGHAAGSEWAASMATYAELKALQRNWDDFDGEFETDDAYGSPGVFLGLIGSEFTRSDIEDLAAKAGIDDDDLYNPSFWEGFADAAVEVFDAVDM